MSNLNDSNRIFKTDQVQKIIIGSGNVLGGTILSTIFSGLQIFIIAGMLGPRLYGLWNILKVIFSYNAYAHLGLLDGMNKQMPYQRGKGNLTKAENIKNYTFWAVLLITIILNIFLILGFHIYARYYPNGITSRAIIILAVTNVLFQLYCFVNSLLRTDKLFFLLSMANVLLSGLSFVFIILFLRYFPDKLIGALVAQLTGYIFVNIYLFIKTKYRVKFDFNFYQIRQTFMIGLPIIIIQVGYIIFITIDRWMISGMLGSTSLGYYGIGQVMANFLFVGASTVAFTLYPFMLEKYGRTNNPRESEQLVYIPIIILSHFISIACALLAFIMPIIFIYILPAYIPGLKAAIILIFGVYFISITPISGNYLLSIDKQNITLNIQLSLIPLSIALSYILIKAGFGIVGVAFGTTISYFFYGTGVIFFALLHITSSKRDLFIKIFKTYVPFILAIIIYILIESLLISKHESLREDIMITFIHVVIFLICSALYLMHFRKSLGVKQILHEVVLLKGRNR